MTPFLSIVTRHMISRPGLYAVHLASLAEQTDQDFEHILIIDDVGRGMKWANQQFSAHAGEVHGNYVLMLDDDDMLTGPNAIAMMRTEVDRTHPDVLFFKVNHGPKLGILPDAQSWQRPPRCGHIGGSAMITRAEVWKEHIHRFNVETTGDIYFLEELWRNGYTRAWLNQILVKCQRVSRGQPE